MRTYSVVVQNISTISVCFFFNICDFIGGGHCLFGKFIFFEFMTFLLLLKVEFMVLLAVIDMYGPDGARGDTDNIKLVLYLCFICFIF